MSRMPALVLGLLASLAFVPLSSGAQYDQRLINISTRARVVTGGNNAVIAGFVISPGPSKQVLIRASGPSLTQPGIGLNTGEVLANPRIEVYDGKSAKILENDNWKVPSGGTLATSADFSAVGAFPFSSDNDAALLATLAPGSYTVIVTGEGTSTGLALVEVYDVSGSSQLINLSTRAEVQTGANIVISGLVVAPGSGLRRVLIRAIGPTLSEFQVANPLANPIMTILNSSGTQIASNDNWGSDGNGPTLASAFASNGAFALPSTSSLDSALIVDLAPGGYTIQVSGVGGTSGVALVEAYDITPSSAPLVSVLATKPTTDTSGAKPAEFTISRTGATTQSITVYFTLSGSAVSGVDFVNVPGAVTIPAGSSSATIEIKPYATTQSTTTTKGVTLTIVDQANYDSPANNSATVSILYTPGSLYVSNLRPSTAATGSVAYGSSTIRLSSDETYALVGLSFSALSAPQTVAYLRIGTINDSGAPYLFQIPNGQASGVQWDIRDSGQYTAADLVQALKEGRIFVSIESAAYPSGELMGAFVKSVGSMVFTPPASPPVISLVNPTSAEAARFLSQASFGPTEASINEVIAKGYQTWITDQMNIPAASHKEAVQADFAANNAGGQGRDPDTNLFRRPGQAHRLNIWWKFSLQGNDQLRQRVAFALSQIMVISDQNGVVENSQDGTANYYDILAKNAFGNFRQLLQDVTLSPMMGIYLTYLRNRKANGGSLPDENYAREVMQLFTIGLVELNPDGTLRLDSLGLPIPTYDQTTISETAKIFTGWAFAQNYSPRPSFLGGGSSNPPANGSDYMDPLRLFPEEHEDGPKTIVGGKLIPAGQGGLKDLNDTLDALFNHPNTGPFICRQLIQRLVTANPSPAYVYRVAQKFANNGSGVRGDLGAVVRAILTDYEARSDAASDANSFGKLKEPLLRVAAVFRALGASTNTGRFVITNSFQFTSQQALSSPTVFNFFEPYYVQPGELAASGLYAPEFQILTSTTAITTTNYLYGYVYANKPTSADNSTTVYMNLTDLLPLAATPDALVDKLDLWLNGAATTATNRARVISAINELPASATSTDKVRAAAYLLISTPDGAIQL
ncbi:MAG: DUF1800 family protein [Opitutaceae bacterium]|nr:DUF1800 family protein [Opitutaceae bacterium]